MVSSSDTPSPITSPAAAIAASERIVVKLGSSVLHHGTGTTGWLEAFATDIIAWQDDGKEVYLVSSGAIGLARAELGTSPQTLADRQAFAAIGQIALAEAWRDAFRKAGGRAAQLLLTRDVTTDRGRYLNARATLRALRRLKATPIINENDTVATDEIRYGDNDMLAALTAGLVQADLLILLSDVDGVYTGNPNTDPTAQHLSAISDLGQDDCIQLHDDNTSTFGTGGMTSKLRAAKQASGWGTQIIIGTGLMDQPLSALAAGSAQATLIRATAPPVPARRRWLEGASGNKGALEIDAGAAAALVEGKSLLSIGVTRIIMPFREGDIISVMHNAIEIGHGRARATSDAINGRAEKIAVHRDDLVLAR